MPHQFDPSSDIRREILATLPHAQKDRAALEKLEVSQLLIIYWNWMSRLVPERKYTIHLSDTLQENRLSALPQCRHALDRIIMLLETGEGINAHLSDRVLIGYNPGHPKRRKNLEGRRDLDLMLNDWGIHHLHLSMHVRPDGFVQRTQQLLLAIFKGDRAFLIDIVQHGSWANQDVAATILRNWPDAGLMFELCGMLPSGEKFTDVERRKLRGAGISVPIEIDEKVYLFASGICTAGNSINAVRSAGELLDRLKKFDKNLNADPTWLPTIMREFGVEPADNLRLGFTFLAQGYGVIEDSSNFLFRLA